MEYVLLAVVLGTNVFLYLQHRDKDKTIKDLTNRLTSRNAGEYAMYNNQQMPAEPLETRRPMSWHDDPNVLEGEDK
ncbi:hypothetical protein [Paenibacillus pabuli]|uniref:hypothetical protein n=1 Tax=Paenibacillus pabuli TaxID=1472 RepID=UPI001FFE847A|nr:hypothetical protein [Paenibacillus pabuli]UPK42473.1 hypothetical protein KET34_25280 [Paenibacillus pabuli]